MNDASRGDAMLRMIVAILGLAFLVATADAATPAQRCAAGKTRETCRKSSCKLRCQARAAQRGTAADPFCLANCEGRYSARFDRIESRGGCATTNDKAAIEAKVDAFVDDVAVEVTGSPAGALLTTTAARRCAAAKIRAVAQKNCDKLRCHAQSKVRGTAPAPTCLSRAEARFNQRFNRAEARGGCATINDRAVLEAKVDAYVADVATELPTGVVTTTTATTTTGPSTSTSGAPTTSTLITLPTTSTLIVITTTTISIPGSTTTTTCCPAQQIETTTSAGVLTVDSLNAFNFPSGVLTRINVGSADATCAHAVSVEQFSVPPFCIQGLGYTSDVFPLGCASGTALGNGKVWDASAACADADVNRSADTSDGTCNPAGQICATAAGGSGANTLGNIDTVRGDGTCDGSGVHTQLDIPVRSLTWSDGDGSPDCPDEDGVFDGMDTVITDFNFVLSPTTATTRAQYLDQNGDGCSYAGGGPASTQRCTNDLSRPCSFPIDCAAGGLCSAGSLQGSPATGPCCTVGQATKVVATGAAFTGGSPLFDLIFANSSPATISACNAPQTLGSCTLTSDPCQD
jgi:hypothetical protein